MEREVKVPRDWIESLLRKGNRINNSQGEVREAWIANLLGYIQSAEFLLSTPVSEKKCAVSGVQRFKDSVEEETLTETGKHLAPSVVPEGIGGVKLL